MAPRGVHPRYVAHQVWREMDDVPSQRRPDEDAFLRRLAQLAARRRQADGQLPGKDEEGAG